MKYKLYTVVSFFFTITYLGAQTNLVPNSNFQTVSKKLKDKGQLNLAQPWISPTLSVADLYVKNSKNPDINAGANSRGEENPMSGDNYAGFRAYSTKGKEPRTYLQVKLTEPLEAGVEYCVTFHVSLSDLSKNACNNLGAYLSINEVSANNNDILIFEPQIVSRRHVIYEQQYDWTPVCAKYKAEGGEEYLTIGNFTPVDKLKINAKIKRPKGFNTPQTNDAYYYLDNVIVTKTIEGERCDCDFIPGVDDVETVNKNFKSEANGNENKVKIIDSYGAPSTTNEVPVSKDKSPAVVSSNQLSDFSVFFEPKKMELSPETVANLEKLIAYLKANPTVKVSLVGFIDASEKVEDKLDGKRVGAIYKYIVSKGIVKESILKSMEGTNNPQKDIKKNMRVDIKIE